MNQEIIVDTSALIAFFVKSETNHQLAEHRYINISDQDDQLIWETFCKYNDKEWSYTDCSILVMANRLSVFEVFAFDEHIRQMAGLGIICVP